MSLESSYEQQYTTKSNYSEQLAARSLSLSPFTHKGICIATLAKTSIRTNAKKEFTRGEFGVKANKEFLAGQVVLHEPSLVHARVVFRADDVNVMQIKDTTSLINELSCVGLLATQCIRKGVTATMLEESYKMRLQIDANDAKFWATDLEVILRRLFGNGRTSKHHKRKVARLLEILSLYCKPVWTPLTRERMAWAIYKYASLLNHDCSPNLAYVYTPSFGFLAVARRDISPGEELTISYCAAIQSADGYYRKLIMSPMLHTDCNCSTCLSDDLNDNISPDTLALEQMPVEFEEHLKRLQFEKDNHGDLRECLGKDNMKSVVARGTLIISLVEEVFRRKSHMTPFWTISCMDQLLNYCSGTATRLGFIPLELEQLYVLTTHLWTVIAAEPALQVEYCAKVLYLFVCIKDARESVDKTNPKAVEWNADDEAMFQQLKNWTTQAPALLGMQVFFSQSLLSQLEHDGASETVEREILCIVDSQVRVGDCLNVV
jgi:hypothetical protein